MFAKMQESSVFIDWYTMVNHLHVCRLETYMIILILSIIGTYDLAVLDENVDDIYASKKPSCRKYGEEKNLTSIFGTTNCFGAYLHPKVVFVAYLIHISLSHTQLSK